MLFWVLLNADSVTDEAGRSVTRFRVLKLRMSKIVSRRGISCSLKADRDVLDLRPSLVTMVATRDFRGVYVCVVVVSGWVVVVVVVGGVGVVTLIFGVEPFDFSTTAS